MFIDIARDALPALVLLFLMTLLMCVLYASLIVFAEGTKYSADFNEPNINALQRIELSTTYPHGTYIRPTVDGYGMEPSPFVSIFRSFWWFFTTATTVGYGDDYPTTNEGRLVGVLTFYTGIVLLALPITIVGGTFAKYYPDWVKAFASDDDKPENESGSRNSSKETPETATLHQPAQQPETLPQPTQTIEIRKAAWGDDDSNCESKQ